MQSEPPTSQPDSFSRLPGWHGLSAQEQGKLVSLVQNPAIFSQLLALQQALFSSNTSAQGPGQAETLQTSSSARKLLDGFSQSQLSFDSQGKSHLVRPVSSLPCFSGLNRELPSPPQFDRSLLQAPLPFWAAQAGCNGPASLLAANTSAIQQSRSGFQRPSPPLPDLNSDLFRSTSLGSRYLSSPPPAELSLRASSMPGSFQDIAARLHMNRAGINTATASMIPVLSQDWLVIPFGTAQQLLPVYAGDVLANDRGDAVMLLDANGRNWPMQCSYSRSQGRFQLGEGWKAFAQHWDLGRGEQLQLSRRFVSSGCIWLDVRIVREEPAPQGPGRQGAGKRKREEVVAEAAQVQSPVAAWISQARTPGPRLQQHATASLQQQSGVLDQPVQAVAPSSPEAGPIITVKRLISCPTYCSRLHVNQHMAEHLLPALPESACIKPPLSYVYQSLFKHKISIIDEQGRVWLVQYEGFVSAAQRHYRFTAGWTNLVKQKGIKVGDAVVLERWTDDRFKLHMHVIKDASDSMVASAVTTTTKGKAKRGTAGTAGMTSHRTRGASKPVPSWSQEAKPYSPGSLEALHDAALLCANSPFPDPSTGTYKQAAASGRDDASNLLGRSAVPAAAVAAADAAVLQQGLFPAVAADMPAQITDAGRAWGQHHSDATCLLPASHNTSDSKDE